MEVRPTSLEAFKTITETGLLSETRLKVYELLFSHPTGLTSAEIDFQLKAPGELRPSYHKRLSEMERLGVVRVAGERTCTITGNNAMVWVTTDRVPSEKDTAILKSMSPPKPRGEEWSVAMADLEALTTLPRSWTLSDDFDKLLVWLRAEATKAMLGKQGRD